jgi:predicted nucleic-acid-binding protein
MIALDTNALVRLLVEDDTEQAATVQQLVLFAEKKSITILILPEVLLEAVWVLESVYNCQRSEISKFLQVMIATATFTMRDDTVIRTVVRQYQKGADFADALITNQAKKEKALALFSFDKDLRKNYPDFVFDDIKTIQHRFK